MKPFYFLATLVLALPLSPACAQSGRDQAEAQALYRQTNARASAAALRQSLSQQPTGFLGDGTFQPGVLRTFDNRRHLVPGLRYHTTLRLLEAQDSMNIDSTHFWPVGSLRGFDLGEPGDPEHPPRRFRPRMVKEGMTTMPHREFVEVLTTVDVAPMLLAWVYLPGPDPEKTGRVPSVPTLMAGPGVGSDEPLRPVVLTQPEVLKLFGKRGEEVRSFAAGQRLHYDKPAEVARMMDYFNRVALAK